MRTFIVFILLLLCQQTTVNGQQNLCKVPEPVECTTLGASTSSATAYPQTADCCPLSVDYYESQIRKADSLYKNYLPQSNFEEVKASMEFFDSIRNEKLAIRNYGRRKAIPNSTFLIPNYQCAKAHYYHAVGLTEKDNIVGACEHYLIALEIMEEMKTNGKRQKAKGKKSVDNPEDYEKIRFVSLIYTRLGEIFLNESCCELAIVNYKKVLYYCESFNDNYSNSQTLKYLGNSFQLYNNADSALYYYNESLKTSSDIVNKLDVEKCIAQILYYKGERDSAFVILKNNLNKITNDNIKYSYHCTLGNMFYIDKEYDSALYYLENSLDINIITKKIAFTTMLSAIYDSLGNDEKKSYYDSFSSQLFLININSNANQSKLLSLYSEYNDRKQEKFKAKTKKRVILSYSLIAIIIISIIVTLRYNHKKHSDRLSEEIKAKDKHIEHNEFKNAYIEGKIKSKNAELQQKDMQIKSQQLKIAELQSRLGNRKDNLKEYYQSEICVKILNKIKELSKSNKDTSELEPLSKEEFVLLFRSANLHLGIFLQNISNKYPSLKKGDLYYLCLVLINLNDKQIAALFGLTYDAIRKRRYKITSILGLNTRENIYKSIIEML